MADADDVVYITQSELEKLVRENASSICKAEQAVVGENCPQSHGSSM